MAKMFYTLDEAAEKLGKSADEVRQMAESGQLQEFRDRDKLMFKREQVDLLAGDDADHGDESKGEGDEVIPLAEQSGGGSGMELSLEDSSSPGSSGSSGPGGSDSGDESGSGPGMAVDDESAKEKSGISIFETDDLDEADPSAQTQVTSTGGGWSMESAGGSGSGLLDLTREVDDTSLGADLLEDVYSGDDAGGSGAAAEGGEADSLFESTGAASDASAGAPTAGMAMMAVEPYDGAGSGYAGGAALGVLIVVAMAMYVTLLGLVGVQGVNLVEAFAANHWMWIGIMAGIVFVPMLIGWIIGKKSG